MIIGGSQWLLAVAVALAIHLAGILWLSLPEPVRQPLAERVGESIVVSLGPDARRSATVVTALSPDVSPDVGAAAAAAVTRPEAISAPASPPAAGEATETPAVVASASLDIARPITPSSLQEVVESRSDAAAPDPSIPAELVDAGSLVPETVGAREVTATKPTDIEAAADVETADVAPAGIEAADVETTEVPLAGIETAGEETADVEPAHIEVTDLETADVDAPTVAVDTSRVSPGQVATPESPEAAVSVEETPDQVSRAGPTRQLESAKIAPAEQPGIKATAARSPDPVVEATTEPDIREAVQPEIIDLQALQESGGGSGVATRYAGVLKGWLQNNMHYPRAARLAGQEGEVVVRFVIDRQGNVQSIVVESKSGFPLLDREAREMIERGDPFPPLPDGMPGQKLEVRVPVDFHVWDETMTKEIPPIYLE